MSVPTQTNIADLRRSLTMLGAFYSKELLINDGELTWCTHASDLLHVV